MKQGVGAAPRLRWRAVIHAGQKPEPGRTQHSLAWHLADCTNPSSAEAHCELVGRGLMALDGNPDGHCEVNGVCPRCALAVAEVVTEPAPEQPPAEPVAESQPPQPAPEPQPAEPTPPPA